MQLDHCPFCGTRHALSSVVSGRHQQIVCGACGARGPEVYAMLPYAPVVESWNRRASPTSGANTTHRADGVPVVQAPSVPQIVSAQPLPDFRLVSGRRTLHEPDRWERLYEVTTSDGMTGEVWLLADGVEGRKP